jgi:hypothetical protein
MVVLCHEKAGFLGDLKAQVLAETVAMGAFAVLVVNSVFARGVA